MCHVDLAGPMPVKSLGGALYMLLIKDEATSFTTVYFLKEKSQSASMIIDYVNFIETQTGSPVKTLKSDSGKEFVNSFLGAFLAEKGIVHERSAPYTPQSNGKIERHVRTIKDYARSMLNRFQSPQFLWAKAVSATVYVWNRMLNKNSGSETPFEHFFKRKPNLGHLRLFGCTGYAHINEQFRNTLDAKSHKCILVGYSGVSQNYRLYDPARRMIIEARNVTFHENIPEMVAKVKVDDNNSEPVSSKHEQATNTESGDSNKEDSNNSGEMTDTTSSESGTTEEIFLDADTTPKGNEEKRTLVVEINTPKGKVVKEVLENTRTKLSFPRLWDRLNLKAPERYSSYSSKEICDPWTYEEAISSPNVEDWKSAMEEEMKSLNEQNTWDLVEKPSQGKVLGNKWVFKTKLNSDGTVARPKARLVIKGYLQRYGVDFTETFSSVCRYETLRAILAIAAERKLQMKQLDVKTAFLYGDLDEEVFMDQPKGFENLDFPSYVCKLKKSLYGLKQAPRCWSNKFVQVMLEKGLIQSECDPSYFYGELLSEPVYLVVYVDDALVLSSSSESIQAVIDHISSKFSIKVGEVSTFVGVQIDRDLDGSILIHWEFMIKQLLDRFSMNDCNPVSIPMCPSTHLSTLTEEDQSIPYRSLIGALLFLAKTTRPDIAFAVAKLSQFTNGYNHEHWMAAKRVLRYLKGTMDLGIKYPSKQASNTMIGHCDSDYAGNRNDRKSQSGFVFFYGEKLISWRSQKQKVVACSSTEAEYVSLADATKESIWIYRLLSEMTLTKQIQLPVEIKMDNTSAIRLANNPEFHQRSKHIDVAYHLSRQYVQSGFLIDYVPSANQLADGLTNPLPTPKHQEMRKEFKMGSRKIISSLFCALLIFMVLTLSSVSFYYI